MSPWWPNILVPLDRNILFRNNIYLFIFNKTRIDAISQRCLLSNYFFLEGYWWFKMVFHCPDPFTLQIRTQSDRNVLLKNIFFCRLHNIKQNNKKCEENQNVDKIRIKVFRKQGWKTFAVVVSVYSVGLYHPTPYHRLVSSAPIRALNTIPVAIILICIRPCGWSLVVGKGS